MGSKYEYLDTKIHIDKIIEGSPFKNLRFLELSPFYFRSGYFFGSFCRVLLDFFQDFIKFFEYSFSLYYQMSHYGFRLGAWWRSEISRSWRRRTRFGVLELRRRTTPPKKYQIVAPYNQTKHLYTFQMHLDLNLWSL